jgi:glycerol uptake facilitator-like aquaporin
MTMQSNNKGDSLTDNLWAEMTLMMVLVVIVLAFAWRNVW